MIRSVICVSILLMAGLVHAEADEPFDPDKISEILAPIGTDRLRELIYTSKSPDYTGLSTAQSKAIAEIRFVVWLGDQTDAWTDKSNRRFDFKGDGKGHSVIEDSDGNQVSFAIYVSERRVVVPAWSAREGSIDRESGIIQWNNGDIWVRNPLSGNWLVSGNDVAKIKDGHFMNFSFGGKTMRVFD